MSSLAVIDHDFNPDRLPWEKQKGESIKAFTAFAIYRDSGVTRSITNTAKALHETGTRAGKVESIRTQCGAWSSKWRWVERAELYDLELDRRTREHQQTKRDQLLDQIGEAGEALRMVGLLRLLGASNDEGKATVVPLDPHEMDAQDVARFIDLGAKLGLRALGEPTEFVKGAFLVAPATVTKMIGAVTDVAMTYIEPALHERFLRDAAEASAGEGLPE